MTLGDTNIVIDYGKAKDVKLRNLVQTHPVGVCGVTRAEILHGARNPIQRASLLILLADFKSLPIPETVWDTVGDHLAALRAHGIAVPFQDVVIATVGITLGIEVWTRDKQFLLIQQVLPALRLFQEPP